MSSGKNMRRSRLYKAGEMKRQMCQRITGTVRNSATTRVSFMGVMNGETTPVAIMLLPAGRRWIMGRATHSNTRFWNGKRQAKITNSVATEARRRRRISSRWPMSVALINCGSAGFSSGPAMAVPAFRLRGFHGLFHLGGVLAHVGGCQLTLDLFVEVAEGGTGAPHPQADATGETRQALGTEHHECDEEDEGELPEAAFEHGAGPALAQCLSLDATLPPADSSPSLAAFLKLRTALPRSSPILGS